MAVKDMTEAPVSEPDALRAGFTGAVAVAEQYGEAIAAELSARGLDIDANLLRTFVLAFWQGVQSEDLTDRSLHTDAEMTLEAWRSFSSFTPDQPVIEILPSPDDRQLSVLRILHPDMPFITDSVLLEIAREDLILQYLHNVTMAFERTDQGKLHGIAQSDSARAEIKETLIYAELLLLDERSRVSLVEQLSRTLRDLRAVVADYPSMRDKAMHLSERMRDHGTDSGTEASAFLSWLCDDHFTFLGYRSFSFADGDIVQESGSELGFLKNRPQSTRRSLADLKPWTRDFLLEPTLLSFSKAGTPSRVHRPAYPDYISVKRFDSNGKVIGEEGFLGLYTSPVYSASPWSIPVLRDKVTWVMNEAGYVPRSFDAKALQQILMTFPRDALFQTPATALYKTATAIAHIHERRRTKVFLRRGRYGMFFNCLVYLPRDSMNTRVRLGIQSLLMERLGASDVEYDAYFSESVLVRLQYILRVDPMAEIDCDIKQLEDDIIALSRDWRADLRRAVKAQGNSGAQGAAQSAEREAEFVDAFPIDYQERFDLQAARTDIGLLRQLETTDEINLHFYRQPDAGPGSVNLKIFKQGALLPLSNVVPVLEHFGFEVVSEYPFRIRTASQDFSIQDLTLTRAGTLDVSVVGALFEDAFRHIWSGRAESDSLNALLIAQRLDWRQIALLRSYARYMKQAAFGFEQSFIAETLLKHGTAAKLLVQQFEALLHPSSANESIEAIYFNYLDGIESLNEDRVLRRLMTLVGATVRTNFFIEQPSDSSLIVHKLATRDIDHLPEPRPLYEIFVYAPDMEGVHLRSSSVARGGIRWSDRLEDFRTEVLGLVKAQIVKNAVIVPSGAKGGFVIKGPSSFEEATRCYRRFITGMLSITDNLVNGALTPPAGVKRRDGDDPYLVVAADKGTASFSDIANEISLAHGFWLGDAFASGGSVGYDHKKMGITARGAWISVQRHFRSLDVDPQSMPITTIGIGDMGGDVFGNGMLQSRQIKLLAAFNHLHIFIDPDPDPERSFEERERLFAMPRSSWADYDASMISNGGGVFARTLKSIPISTAMQQAFDISAAALTPEELLHELLRAPVDLIWNGGIGTYIKATGESHDDVGDRANDTVRVNGSEVRARVIGEGGNLGLTHAGRIEYARNGGRVNADFIDNAGGVDCSDHEVNLKILLARAVDAGEIAPSERDALLLDHDDDVAALVLRNNFVQARALALALEHSQGRTDEYNRLASRLEVALGFDRSEADFPTEEVLDEHARTGHSLTLPELSTLLGYAKILLKAQLAPADLQSDPAIAAIAAREFPQPLVARFGKHLPEHRLYSDIIDTLLANDVIGFGGVTFVNRIMEFVGCDPDTVVRAYWVCAELFGLRERTDWIDGAQAPVLVKRAAMLELVRFCRRVTRWLIRNHRTDLSVSGLLARYAEAIPTLLADPATLFLTRAEARRFAERSERLQTADAPIPSAGLGFEMFGALAVAEAAARSGQSANKTGPIYRALGKALKIDRMSDHLAALDTNSHWHAMERDALLDDLCERQLAVTEEVLREGVSAEDWIAAHRPFVDRWLAIMADAPLESGDAFAGLSMTVRKLIDLSRQTAGLSHLR